MLHGTAVGAPRLIALPGGTFLMLKAEDVPTGGVLLRSTDGRAWNSVESGAGGLDAGAILDLAASATTAVILGTTEPMSGTGTAVLDAAEWTSADGVTWTRAPGSDALQAIGARDIVGAPGGFAAVGDARLTVLLSGADGRQWRRTELPVAGAAPASVEYVVPAAGGFLAVGFVDGRSAMWQWDGNAWTRLSFDEEASITSFVATDQWIIATGSIEIPDPVKPGQTTIATVGRQSTDAGATWGSTGLALDGIADVRLFAIDGGFLAVLTPGDPRARVVAVRSSSPGNWEPVALDTAGTESNPMIITAAAISGRRVVLAGHTVGTGAGGDRVDVWTGDATAP